MVTELVQLPWPVHVRGSCGWSTTPARCRRPATWGSRPPADHVFFWLVHQWVFRTTLGFTGGGEGWPAPGGVGPFAGGVKLCFTGLRRASRVKVGETGDRCLTCWRCGSASSPDLASTNTAMCWLHGTLGHAERLGERCHRRPAHPFQVPRRWTARRTGGTLACGMLVSVAMRASTTPNRVRWLTVSPFLPAWPGCSWRGPPVRGGIGVSDLSPGGMSVYRCG